MIKFRALKSNLIQCRRQSQKIDECEVGTIRAAFLQEQEQLSKLNGSIMMRLRKQMHTITDIDYKIQQINQEQTPFQFVKKLSELSNHDDPNLTKKFGCFQDQKNESAHFDCLDTVKKESTAKLADLQNESSILSNEERSQQIQIQSRRLNQLSSREEPLKIKFIRINVNDGKGEKVSPKISSADSSLHSYEEEYERYVNQTFNSEEYDELRNYSPSQMLYEDEFDDQLFAPRSNDKEIVHIFSYSKEKEDLSPLSKITERSSEYMSPQPTNQYRNEFPEESLEYKKILYMLETTDRQKKKEKSQTTPSEFVQDDRKLENSNIIEKKRSITNKAAGKKEALNQIVNMLQTKYNRTLDLKNKSVMKAPKKK